MLAAWCDEYVMIHYNSKPNAYCRAVNAETFQTIEHNPVWISILLYTRNPYSYSHFEIVVCIYSVRGAIDQMPTNTPSYSICSAPIVYIFVYILIETCIAPLTVLLLTSTRQMNLFKNITCMLLYVCVCIKRLCLVHFVTIGDWFQALYCVYLLLL